MAGKVKANRRDSRRFYTHQAVDKSYMGKSLESGPAGYGRRLPGIPEYRLAFEIEMDAVGDVIIGTLSAGLILSGQVGLHTDITGGAIVLKLPAHGGLAAVTNLCTIANAASPVMTTLNTAVLVPYAIDRPIAYSVSGGTAGEKAQLSLPAWPVDNGWF